MSGVIVDEATPPQAALILLELFVEATYVCRCKFGKPADHNNRHLGRRWQHEHEVAHSARQPNVPIGATLAST